jgi:3-(methylthio)propanoyl-CoA dehydrogenase
MTNGLANPADALAGATPYLRLCSLVTGGWLLARSACAASRIAATGQGDAEFLAQKVVTARFYCDQILPQVHGLLPAVTAGVGDLAAARF